MFERLLLWRRKGNSEPLQSNTYVELLDSSGSSGGALLVHSVESRRRFEEHLRMSFEQGRCGHNGVISSALWDKIGPVATILTPAISSGQLLQIVGSPAVLEGLRNGTFSMLQTASGLTGTVVNNQTGLFVGQLRFAKASVAPIVAPVAIWQVVNTLAGVSHLARINARLDTIQRSVERVLGRQQADVYGRLTAALRIIDELEEQHSLTGSFDSGMQVRLATASYEIQRAYFEMSFIVERFMNKSRHIIATTSKKQGVTSTLQILREEEAEYTLDAHLCIAASYALVRAEQMWVKHDLEHSLDYAVRRVDNLKGYLDKYEYALKSPAIIAELDSHAKSCLEQLSWLRREVFHRRLTREIKEREEKHDTSVKPTAPEIHYPNLFVWRDGRDNDVKVVTIESRAA